MTEEQGLETFSLLSDDQLVANIYEGQILIAPKKVFVKELENEKA
jgi:hypothetical protein